MFSTKSASTSTAAQPPVAISAFRVQTSIQGLVIQKGYGTNRTAGNIIGVNDFQAIQHDTPQPVSGGGGKGLGSGGGQQSSVTTSFTYQMAVQIGICNSVVTAIGKVWQDKSVTSLAALGLSLFNGTNPQAPWGYLQTVHPEQALQYNGLSYVAGATYQLSASASMQNNTFEVFTATQYNPAAGIIDANPRDIIVDWLTNPIDGSNFPIEFLDDLTNYSNYCVALGLFMSPFVDSQIESRQFLDDLAKMTNSEWVSSVDKLKLIPYGDTTVSGNGATYTPDLTPLFDITDEDYQFDDGSDPVITTRGNPADATNSVKIEIVDRAHDYNVVVIEARDQSHIEKYGLRQDASITAHGITSPSVGQRVTAAIMQRALYVRNIHTFNVGWKYGVLEPMDYVTISDGETGLFRQLVRIRTLDEDDQGRLRIVAEEVDVGVAHAPTYGQQASSGQRLDNNAPPPAMNAPIIFGGPIQLVNGLEMWMAASGPNGYGGCDVWVSSDNTTYKRIGRMFGSSRMGVLTATLPVGPDPDTTDVCSVDISMSSNNIILSGTKDDADLANTLCFIQDASGSGEFFSYQTAELTGTGKYKLKDYLRRGLYSQQILQHVAGASFACLNSSIFKIPYTADQISRLIWVKLTAFNTHGAAEQELTDVQPTAFVAPSPPPPADVEDFSAIQAGEVVAFTWKRIDNALLLGYDIRFGPAGVFAWDEMLPLTEAAAGAYDANASVPSGNWTFAIRARDIADQLSPNAAYSTRTIIDLYPPVSSVQQAPNWPGVKVGCVVHYSGVLIPESQVTADTDLESNVFDNFVWQPVDEYSYEAPPVTMSKVAQVRVSAALTAKLGPGETEGKPNPLLFARYSQLGVDEVTPMWNADDTTLMWSDDPSTLMWAGVTEYELWTKGVVRTTYVQEKIVVNTHDGVTILQSFLAKVDQPIINDGGNGVVVSPGGTRINFNTPDYLFDPFVTPVAVGAGLFATSSNVDPDGFTCHVFNVNAGGTDVGGTVNWSSHN